MSNDQYNIMELLDVCGLPHDPIDRLFGTLPPLTPIDSEYTRVMRLGPHPCRYDTDGTTPIFMSYQIDVWGPPESYGYSSYLVLEDTAPDYIPDYTQKVAAKTAQRPIHHYCRMERFTTILRQLLGQGDISEDVLDLCRYECAPNPATIWNTMRGVLKTHKLRLYYNRIPGIIAALNLFPPPAITNDVYLAIHEDFLLLATRFTQHGLHPFKRTYFPSMRFITLCLLQVHGVTFPYDIPKARTHRKGKVLVEIWQHLLIQK